MTTKRKTLPSRAVGRGKRGGGQVDDVTALLKLQKTSDPERCESPKGSVVVKEKPRRSKEKLRHVRGEKKRTTLAKHQRKTKGDTIQNILASGRKLLTLSRNRDIRKEVPRDEQEIHTSGEGRWRGTNGERCFSSLKRFIFCPSKKKKRLVSHESELPTPGIKPQRRLGGNGNKGRVSGNPVLLGSDSKKGGRRCRGEEGDGCSRIKKGVHTELNRIRGRKYWPAR